MRWRKLTSCLSLLMAAERPYKHAYECKRSYETPSSTLEPTLCLCLPHTTVYTSGRARMECHRSSDNFFVWSWMSYERAYERGCSYGTPCSALDLFAVSVEDPYEHAYKRLCSYGMSSLALLPLVGFCWSCPRLIRPVIRPRRSYARPSFVLSLPRPCFLR